MCFVFDRGGGDEATLVALIRFVGGCGGAVGKVIAVESLNTDDATDAADAAALGEVLLLDSRLCDALLLLY